MDKMTRREFLKMAGSAAVGAAAYGAGLQNVFAAGEGSVKVTGNGGAGSQPCQSIFQQKHQRRNAD